jgi:transcriptional regulator with XRE-family HTH domain
VATAKRPPSPAQTVKELGWGIRKIRQEKNLSQAQLAELCDLHPTYVSIIERGVKSTTVFTLSKIARALGQKPSELLANSGL